MKQDAPEKYTEADQIEGLIQSAQHVVIVQADNPDGDSLCSALALEQILGDMGKQTSLYCRIGIPSYLHYLEGWDRVNRELPSKFDLSIIVDTSAEELLENDSHNLPKQALSTKPCIVIDHHAVKPTITYATVICNQTAVATGEVIYELATQLDWQLNLRAKEMITTSILADSLGLTSEATTARSVYILAELVGGGVKIADLERRRRELMRKSADILRYKGELLQRIEYFADSRIAIITIPWEEIQQYSQEYNPSVLVIDDMRLVNDVDVAIAFKLYKDGRVTAKIKCNYGIGIASALAEHFGGGGHPYASGFKVTNHQSFAEIKTECIDYATRLLDKLKKGNNSNEDLQHTNQAS